MPIVNTLIGGSGNSGVDSFKEYKLPDEFNTLSNIVSCLLPNGDTLFGSNASGTTFGLWYFDRTTGETTHIVNEGMFINFTLTPTGVLATGTMDDMGLYFIPTGSKIPQQIIDYGTRWTYQTVTDYGVVIGSNLTNGSYYFRFSDNSLTQLTPNARNWNAFITDGLVILSNTQIGTGATISYIDELADTISLVPLDTTLLPSYGGLVDFYEDLNKTFVLFSQRTSTYRGIYKFDYTTKVVAKVFDDFYYMQYGYVGETAILMASNISAVKGIVEYKISTGECTLIYNDYNYQTLVGFGDYCLATSSIVNSKLVKYDFSDNTYEQPITNITTPLNALVETPQGGYLYSNARTSNLYFVDRNSFVSQIWTNSNSRVLSNYIIADNVAPENQMIVFGGATNSSYGILAVRLIDRTTIYNYLTDYSGLGNFALTTDGIIIAPVVSTTTNVYFLRADYMYQYMPELIEDVSIFGITTLFEDDFNVYASAKLSANSKGLFKIRGTTVTKLLDYGFNYDTTTEIWQKKVLLSEYITYDITNEEREDFMAWYYLYNNYGISNRIDTKIIIQDLTTKGYIVGETYSYKMPLANDNYVVMYSSYSIITGYIGR